MSNLGTSNDGQVRLLEATEHTSGQVEMLGALAMDAEVMKGKTPIAGRQAAKRERARVVEACRQSIRSYKTARNRLLVGAVVCFAIAAGVGLTVAGTVTGASVAAVSILLLGLIIRAGYCV